MEYSKKGKTAGDQELLKMDTEPKGNIARVIKLRVILVLGSSQWD